MIHFKWLLRLPTFFLFGAWCSLCIAPNCLAMTAPESLGKKRLTDRNRHNGVCRAASGKFSPNRPTGLIWSSSRNVCPWLCPLPMRFSQGRKGVPRGAKPSHTVASVPWKNIHTNMYIITTGSPPPPCRLMDRSHVGVHVEVLLTD